MGFGAGHDEQVAAAVREHLRPGEEFRAAVWVSKADGRTSTGMTRAEMSPFRFRRLPPTGRRGADGPPRSLAEELDQHVRLVTDPRVLARTDRRLMVLSQGGGFWRRLLHPASGRPPGLRLRWECRRPELVSATEKDRRLRLAFADGSTILLLTPAARIQPFLTD
ncbi:hypothetical protein [Actinoplanes siamensis]|uniref:Uncharacterized protein n=1 Tax=Actinoplanes siamensis TaxID=1223317 RepID=A0A919TIX1_9ACTN|nr:hypothetical protein [Actinoplanes siamensis]GIF04193.1 hypothetical protein Asi03nite_17310 [Actinoplanes siamensis]